MPKKSKPKGVKERYFTRKDLSGRMWAVIEKESENLAIISIGQNVIGALIFERRKDLETALRMLPIKRRRFLKAHPVRVIVE